MCPGTVFGVLRQQSHDTLVDQFKAVVVHTLADAAARVPSHFLRNQRQRRPVSVLRCAGRAAAVGGGT